MPFILHLQTSSDICFNSSAKYLNFPQELKTKKNFLSIKRTNDQQSYYQGNSSRKLLIATESIYRFSKLQNSRSTLFKELLDKYWEQSIFLSDSTPLLRQYSSLISKQQSQLAKNKKKQLMTSFTKALYNGSIDAESLLTTPRTDDNVSQSVRYLLRKTFRFRQPIFKNRLSLGQARDKPSTDPYSILLQKLSLNSCPTFVVTNGFDQLVLSESVSQIALKQSPFVSIKQWYHDHFGHIHDQSSVYEGWFFVNPQDAYEYKHFIQSKYPRSANQNGLNVSHANLYAYYRLNRQSLPRIEFRLFPDLEEIGKLITKRSHKNKVTFDKRQKYGKNYFQGQPIYFIESAIGRNPEDKSPTEVRYFYKVPGDPSGKKYTAIFFNKNVAVRAWKQFCLDSPNYNMPETPKLRVYNLEDFLKDNEESTHTLEQDFIFIPGNKAYEEINDNCFEDGLSVSRVDTKIPAYKLTLSLWTKRLIWSLTSRQPPNW
uniref:hypothetical protein n=1 Tax=Nemalion vermiculare TaxID=935621 RepID=UPI00257A7D82|nr:hypothetical protein QU266_pgp136 [Nemalion vermiculare]WGV34322.1 hypothetical protein [Nemalion vermiculare]